MPGIPQKVNCRVHNVSDGSKHLVFTLDGSTQCVGEIRIVGDEKYLLCMAQMFSDWASRERGKPVLPSAIRNIMNGSRRN